MTSELRTLIELRDVIGLEFDCPKCHAKVLQPLHTNETRQTIHQCPSCGANWYLTERKTDAPDQISSFMETLESIAAHKDLYAKIRFCVACISK